MFFDIEGVQDYVFPGKLEYLFGVYYEENGEKIFKPFWAHNKNEEKQSVIDFFAFTKAHFKKYPKAKKVKGGYIITGSKNWISNRTYGYEIKKSIHTDIDNIKDFIFAQAILKNGLFKKIK